MIWLCKNKNKNYEFKSLSLTLRLNLGLTPESKLWGGLVSFPEIKLRSTQASTLTRIFACSSALSDLS